MDIETTQVHIKNLNDIARNIHDCPSSAAVAFICGAAERLRVLQERLTAAESEIKVTNELLEQRQRVLDAIPECEPHGKCVPHAIEWIENIISERDQLRAQLEAAKGYKYVGEVIAASQDRHDLLVAVRFDIFENLKVGDKVYATPILPEQATPAESVHIKAIKQAIQFIENGVELGFIRMPDADTKDSAHDTLPLLKSALAALPKVEQVSGGGDDDGATIRDVYFHETPEPKWFSSSNKADVQNSHRYNLEFAALRLEDIKEISAAKANISEWCDEALVCVKAVLDSLPPLKDE